MARGKKMLSYSHFAVLWPPLPSETPESFESQLLEICGRSWGKDASGIDRDSRLIHSEFKGVRE